MINKRLVSYLKEDKKYIYLQVLMQWLALISQVVIVAIIANMINELYQGHQVNNFSIKIIIIIVLILIKGYFGKLVSSFSFKAATFALIFSFRAAVTSFPNNCFAIFMFLLISVFLIRC